MKLNKYKLGDLIEQRREKIDEIIVVKPNEKYHIGIPCIFHEITNLYCPGCGVTRMIFSILKLDFYQAFRYNPFIFILLILLIIYIAYIIICKILKKKYYKLNIKHLIIISAIAIIFMILRNIEYFSYLQPTKI